MRPQAVAYGFAIFPDGDGWIWQAYGGGGRVRATGRAATRAVAAALVVREIMRTSTFAGGTRAA